MLLKRTLIAVATVTLVGIARSQGQSILGPTAYLSTADSPWISDINLGSVLVEDFEDTSYISGWSADHGARLLPSSNTDSVDADGTGGINGSGTTGTSWYYNAGGLTTDPSPITITFSGPYPTKAGLVWTDGRNPITFEAFDENGTSLGTTGGSHADGVFSGGTSEDRFYGAVNAGGISKIVITAADAVEMDHLQFGAPVPEPSTYAAVFAVGLAGFAVYRRRIARSA